MLPKTTGIQLNNYYQNDFTCTDCDTSCSRKETLLSHMRSHKDDEIYSCKHCDKCFFTKLQLDKHLESHNDSKVQCADCGEAFSDKKV